MKAASPSIDLTLTANIAQQAARKAVRDAMESRERDSPWEITEAFLKIAVLLALLSEKRKSEPALFRVADELLIGDIANIPVAVGISPKHPIDLVLLHPLMRDDHQCDPWSDRTRCAMGLIEIKKDFGAVSGDAQWLSAVAKHTSIEPSVEWVMLVVFINGSSSREVLSNAANVQRAVANFDFHPITTCAPEEPKPISSPVSPIRHPLFDVMCYGKRV
jgi:hypothetical protein